MNRFKHTVVVGSGAVGSFFGAMLARAGHRVTLIGRAAHVAAIERDGLRLDMAGKVESIRVAAGTELAAAKTADLILFCVKSTDTDAVARELAALLAPGAVVLSLQNGVENAEMIARHVSVPVVPAVVYVATAMVAPGVVRHHGRGDLVIGPPQSGDAAANESLLQQVVELFASAGVKVSISNDVTAELWSKLLVNCAYNAISALAQAPYSALAALPEVHQLQQQVVCEVVALAHAEGIALSLDASMQAMDRIAVTMPGQLSSTAQDMARRKPSEIDHLNGFIVRHGRELGVPTPANQALFALVKLVEAGYGRKSRGNDQRGSGSDDTRDDGRRE